MPCPSLSRPSGFAGVLPTLEDYAKNRASFILGGAGCFFPPCVAVAEAVSVAQHLWEDAIGGCCLEPPCSGWLSASISAS